MESRYGQDKTVSVSLDIIRQVGLALDTVVFNKVCLVLNSLSFSGWSVPWAIFVVHGIYGELLWMERY